MIFQALDRRNTLLEQDVDPRAFDITPQSIDREVFLVFEMIEKGALGNPGSLGDVLNRTPPEAKGMERINRTARQLLAQAWPSHDTSRGETFLELPSI